MTRVATIAFVVAAGDAWCQPQQAHARSGRRAYEMVSPIAKGGYGVQEINAVSSEGTSVAFTSLGAFAGVAAGPASADYMAQREAWGWATRPLVAPASLLTTQLAYDLSPALDESLVLGVTASNVGHARDENFEDDIFRHATTTPDVDAYWQMVGKLSLANALEEQRLQAAYVGASPDLCHVFVEEGRPLLPLPELYDEIYEIYEMPNACDGTETPLRLVGLDNGGRVIDGLCSVELGTGMSSSYERIGKGSAFNAVAADGKAVFFTAGVEEVVRSKEECPDHQVFVRLDGLRTLEVSRPPEAGQPFGGCESGGVAGEVPCVGAELRQAAQFAGANEEGNVVFFSTPNALENGKPGELYVARLGCLPGVEPCAPAEWEVLSVAPVAVSDRSGGSADVQGVVRVAPDGSRIYYVATGVLSDEKDGEGRRPLEGADNLYVYDVDTGSTGFLSDLCSGPERSHNAIDAQCPDDLNESEGANSTNDRDVWIDTYESEAQTGGASGEFLVFSSFGRLTVDDTGEAKNVYRYDAVTGDLERVSVGEEGVDDNGDDSASNATIAFGRPGGPVVEQYEMNTRAIAEDGSRIVFRTAEPLSERDSNGLINVYEWFREPGWSSGRVSMISCGCSTEDDKQVVISKSGQEVLFTTAAGLLRQDTDDAVDIYDAHECTTSTPCSTPPPGEGERCEGEGCYGPLSDPQPLLVAATTTQSSAGDVSGAAGTRTPKTRKKQAAKRSTGRGERCTTRRTVSARPRHNNRRRNAAAKSTCKTPPRRVLTVSSGS